MVELSVLVFGIAFGRLDSKTSVKRVLIITTSVALVYSAVQVRIWKVHHFLRTTYMNNLFGN